MTIVIADIHGAYLALVELIEKLPKDKIKKFIFLGDYVDGWSQSAEVVQFLIELNTKFECIFMLGNHDEWCRDWILFGRENPTWTPNGGESTIRSYIENNPELLLSEEHRKFFRKLNYYYIDDNNRLFIHGGYTNLKGVHKEHYKSNCCWDRTLWEMSLASRHVQEDDIPRRLRNYNEIYLGHTATINWKYKKNFYANDAYRGVNGEAESVLGKPITTPINALNVWNLDTGAGFNGKLTAMDIETKQYWQSSLVMNLYKNEKGRN